MITVKEIQEYVLKMLDGNPEYTFKKAKLYFSTYYKDFLQYYKQHLFALEQIKLSRDRTGFLFNMQEYLLNSAELIIDFISSFYSKMSEIAKSEDTKRNPMYFHKAIQLFSDAYSKIDNKIHESVIGRAADAGQSYQEFFEEMFNKYAGKKDADLLINELAIIQKEIETFGNTNFEKLAINEIDNDLINTIGEE